MDPAAVLLDPSLARLIVERVQASLQKDVCVLSATGQVLAGTPGAPEAVTVPLVHGGTVVGSVVINDAPERGQMYARLVAAYAELLLHQETEARNAAMGAPAAAQQLRDTFLYALLTGQLTQDEDTTRQRAEILGLNLGRSYAVMVIRVVNARPGVPGPGRYDLVADAMRFFARGRGAIAAYMGSETVAVLVPVDETTSASATSPTGSSLVSGYHDVKARLLTAAEAVVHALSGGRQATAGVGRLHPGLGGLAESYREAITALEVGLRLSGPGRAYHPDDLRVAIMVYEAPVALREQLTQELLAPLEPHPELLATVATFLEQEMSPSRAAQALALHRSTLHYRLDRVQQLTGRDPRRFADAVHFHLALLVHRLSRWESAGHPTLATRAG